MNRKYLRALLMVMGTWRCMNVHFWSRMGILKTGIESGELVLTCRWKDSGTGAGKQGCSAVHLEHLASLVLDMLTLSEATFLWSPGKDSLSARFQPEQASLSLQAMSCW